MILPLLAEDVVLALTVSVWIPESADFGLIHSGMELMEYSIFAVTVTVMSC